MKNIARMLLGAVCAGGLLATIATVSAAETGYPDRPVTIIVPFSPGGTPDLLARAVGDHLSKTLGQPFVVENRPGANGVAASQVTANADNDGYTLMIGSMTTHVFNRAMRELPYDPLTAFDAVALIGYSPTLIVTNQRSGITSLEEVIAISKDKPGSLAYATSGVGTAGHLGAEFLQRSAGLDLLHIPYDGNSQAVIDILSGEVDLGFTAVNNMIQYVRSGDILPLAITSTQRSALLPDVPAITEFYPGSDIELWYGIFAPAGTPQDVVEKLNAEINTLLASDDMISRWADNGVTITQASAGDFSALFAADVEKWTEVIDAVGLGH